MQYDQYDTVADNVEKAVGHQCPAWHLQILRYDQLSPDSKINGPPPWLRFVAIRRDSHGPTAIGPFTVLLEQKSPEQLGREICALLNRLWRLTGRKQAKKSDRAQFDDAGGYQQRSSKRP